MCVPNRFLYWWRSWIITKTPVSLRLTLSFIYFFIYLYLPTHTNKYKYKQPEKWNKQPNKLLWYTPKIKNPINNRDQSTDHDLFYILLLFLCSRRTPRHFLLLLFSLGWCPWVRSSHKVSSRHPTPTTHVIGIWIRPHPVTSTPTKHPCPPMRHICSSLCIRIVVVIVVVIRIGSWHAGIRWRHHHVGIHSPVGIVWHVGTSWKTGAWSSK